MRQWVVRCVLYPGLDDSILALTDELVRLGYARVHRVTDAHTLVDFLPPAYGPNSLVPPVDWARDQAQRLEAMGVSAVAAPPWVEA